MRKRERQGEGVEEEECKGRRRVRRERIHA